MHPWESRHPRGAEGEETPSWAARGTPWETVILEEDTWERWLDPNLDDTNELESFLRPTEEHTLVRRPVNRAVGTVGNDSPTLLDPPEDGGAPDAGRATP